MTTKLKGRVTSGMDSFVADLQVLGTETKRGLLETLMQEGRLLSRLLVKLTPPKRKSQGIRNVKADINRAIRPLEPKNFSADWIKRMIKAHDARKLETYFHRDSQSGPMSRYKIVTFHRRYHLQARNKARRVPKNQFIATPDHREQKAYVRKIQRTVGRAKGGWVKGAELFKAKPAQWVRKHKDQGRVIDKRRDAKRPSVRLINESSWAGTSHAQRVTDTAVKSRRRAMLIRVSLVQGRIMGHRIKRAYSANRKAA